MDARRALPRLRELLDPLPPGVHLEVDEDDQVRVFVRRDMLHLDADALHDRLQHWTQTELARALPAASATVSFRHALPANPDEAASLDLQEGWRRLEPTLLLDAPAATHEELPAFAALLPRFLALVHGRGRPEGYRSPEVGTME